jgi:hypothetical protein
MAQPSIIYGDVIYQGTVNFAGPVFLPDAVITNAKVAAAADIAASKLIHRFAVSVQLFAPGATIIAVASQLLLVCRKGGELVSVEAAITTQATGGDRTVSIDIQKSTGGGAFATALSSPVAITNATAIRTAVAGVVGGAPSYIDGDVYQAVVTVAGAAGAQAAGLMLTVTFDQHPNT